MMQILKKNWFVISKMTRFLWIVTRALEILKLSTLIGSFCAKYIKFDLKKYREVIFHDAKEWCKIWRKTDLWFGHWHEEFGKFSPGTWKFQNWDFNGILLSRVGNVWASNLKKSYVSWKWKKFEEELTYHFKIGMRNLKNFGPSTQKSKQSI